jgi:hypothetical protein
MRKVKYYFSIYQTTVLTAQVIPYPETVDGVDEVEAVFDEHYHGIA